MLLDITIVTVLQRQHPVLSPTNMSPKTHFFNRYCFIFTNFASIAHFVRPVGYNSWFDYDIVFLPSRPSLHVCTLQEST